MFRSRTGCLIMVLAFLWAWAAVWPGPATAGETQPFPFGLGGYLQRVMDYPDLMGRVAGLAAASGAGWTREEFEWSALQPSPGVWNRDRLTRVDQMVDLALASGLKIVGLINGPSAWSNGAAPSDLEDYEEFASFAAFLARRYEGRINHWEIWNEPNTARFWAPEPDPAAYAGLLEKVYPAVKKAAPEALILGGALADPQDLVYIFALLAHGASPHMDILSVHPYTAPDPLENSVEEVELRLLGRLTAQFGEEKPVWITEMGFPTCETAKGVTRERQARLLVRSYLAALSAGVRVVQWYDFRDDGIDSGDCEQMFGLVTHESADQALSPKPAYHAFAAMAALLGSSPFAEEWDLGYDFRGLVFRERDTGAKTLALWLVDRTGENREVEFSLNLSGTVDWVRDIYGREKAYQYNGTTLSLTLSGAPVYLQGDLRRE